MKQLSALPLPLGTEIKPYGKIGAVSVRDGERYYMLVSKDDDVALMPATLIEAMFKQ